MTTPRPTGPLERALDALRDMPVPDARPADADVLARLASASPSAPVSPKRRNWMRIATRWSLAAGVLIAGAAVYFLSAPPSMADVIKAAEKHNLVRYKVEQTTEDKDNGTGTSQMVHYADLSKPRWRIEGVPVTTLNGNVESKYYQVQSDPDDRWLGVNTETLVKGYDKDAPEVKDFIDKYGAGGRKEATLMRAPGKDARKNTKTFLDWLRALEKHKDVKVTREKVDGKKAVRYDVEEDEGKKVTTLWVDPTPRITSNKLVYTDFEWGPKLPKGKKIDDLFDTKPPKGYKLSDYTKKKEETKKAETRKANDD
jgi:hypothetical protein